VLHRSRSLFWASRGTVRAGQSRVAPHFNVERSALAEAHANAALMFAFFGLLQLTKSMSPESVGELGPLANGLAKEYTSLSEHAQGACCAASSAEVAGKLRTRVQDLGSSCVGLVQNAGSVQVDPSDSFARRDLAENARLVSEKAS